MRQRNWSKAVDLLADIDLDNVVTGNAGHICHLLGFGLFGTGDAKGALDIWQKGADMERSRCDFAPLLTYGRFAVMNAQERAAAYREGAFSESLYLIEKMERYIADKDWQAVIDMMEKYNTRSLRNIQITGRLAMAWLHLDIATSDDLPYLLKTLALTSFCDEWRKSKDNGLFNFMPLPPYLTSWSDKHFDEVTSDAQAWLE